MVSPKSPYFPSPSGTLWGVYDFLERFVGIRWYYPGRLGTVVPKRETLIIPPVAYQDAPVFRKRVIYRFHGQPPVPGQEGRDYIYAHFRIADTSGVPTPCHTPHNWAAVYGQTHPEYFQMGSDGRRIPPMWCYSEPGVLKQFVEDLDHFYRSGGTWTEPWGRGSLPTEKYIPVSPVDMPVECQCPRCQALADKDSRLGYASRILGEFLYKLCLEVKKKWPEKTVVFLPYSNYTEPPENIIFPDNFGVALCWMRTVANLKEPEIWKRELEIFEGWKRITSQPMSHWIYTCWPANDTKAPFQFPHVMKKFFSLTRGSIGFFCDAGVDWPRTHLTHYLMARLMWNPDFDVDAALKEYYRLMYGKASRTMEKIFSILIDGWEKSRWKPPLPDYHQVSLRIVHEETCPESAVRELKQLVEKAHGEVPAGSLEGQRVKFFQTALEPFFAESAAFHQKKLRKALNILKVGSIPLLDGKLDEDIWTRTETGSFVSLDKENPVPRFPTTVKGVWLPGKGLVLGFRMVEPDPAGIRMNYLTHDSLVYLDDCVEIFLDPRADEGQFYQIATNAAGTLFDCFYYSQMKGWHARGVVSKSFIGEDFWSLEVYIPFECLGVNEVKPGSIWLGNFTRSRRREGPGNELSRFSTSYEPDLVKLNLKTQHFATLRFVE
ncbi:MAG TPA: DUF4838 domain-containing protein [bacterium]|nr:DUF4838 domain-containing protein [bacterium]HPP11540.1 DUF4838 domain-containing protein [bacterium]